MLNKRIITKLNNDIQKIAILIGIGYKGTELEMSDAYYDLHKFYTYLINIGFANDDIILITDSEAFENRIEPTSSNILFYINELVNFGNKDDQKRYLVLYYTGHGTRLIDKNKNKIIEALVPNNYYECNLIKGSFLKEKLIDKLNSNVTIFNFIDCCYSGNLINLKYKYHNTNKYINNKYDTSICNAYLLSSCRNNQISLKMLIELDNKNREKRSLLTWAFCEKYKTNSILSSLLKNIQLHLNIKFKNVQTIQFLCNKDIDLNNLAIPELIQLS